MERLQKLIKETNLSNYRVAQDLHLPESTVRSWVKGRAIPRQKHMIALSEYFKVHPAWLQYGDPEYAPAETDRIKYLIKEAEELGVSEDIVQYGKFRISEAKKLKYKGKTESRTVRHKVGG